MTILRTRPEQPGKVTRTVHDPQDSYLRKLHTKNDDVAADWNRADVWSEFRPRLGGLRQTLQQCDPTKHIFAKPQGSRRIFGSDAGIDSSEVSPRLPAKDNLRHFSELAITRLSSKSARNFVE